MVAEVQDVERGMRRPFPSTFTAIRWSAVLAGTVAGIATYLLLTLFGIASGLTAVDPTAAEPVGAVPIWTGVWSVISMLIAAFVGGWAAGRMSGLRRRGDGMLHGFVAWGLTVLLFAWLTTTAVASILGGTLNIFGQTIQGAAQAAGGGVAGQVQELITGTPGGADISTESLSAFQQRLEAQDRNGAIDVLVNQMGFSQERATQIVDQAMPLVGGGQLQQTAEGAVSGLTAASWWLFAALLLSLGLGILGGAIGTRAVSNRTVGDHTQERHHFNA